MTNMPEVNLAREAEMCYATIAMVTDFDCWHPDHDNVDVEKIIRVSRDNAHRARQLIASVTPAIGPHPDLCPHGCDRALDNAVLTPPERRDATLVHKLAAVARRIL